MEVPPSACRRFCSRARRRARATASAESCAEADWTDKHHVLAKSVMLSTPQQQLPRSEHPPCLHFWSGLSWEKKRKHQEEDTPEVDLHDGSSLSCQDHELLAWGVLGCARGNDAPRPSCKATCALYVGVGTSYGLNGHAILRRQRCRHAECLSDLPSSAVMKGDSSAGSLRASTTGAAPKDCDYYTCMRPLPVPHLAFHSVASPSLWKQVFGSSMSLNTAGDS